VPDEQFADAGWGEAPEVGVGVGGAHSAHRRCGGEEYTPRPQRAVAVLDARSGLSDEMKRLGEDDAVVAVRR
jgi:hypothetical protein